MIHLLNPDDYHSQRNNKEKPHHECGNTSVANLLHTTGYDWRYTPPFMMLDDYVYTILREKVCQQYALTGICSEWATRSPEQSLPMLAFVSTMLSGKGHTADDTCDMETLDYLLDNGVASILATRFYKGQKNGHFVLLAGRTPTGYIIDDPYGDPNTGYENKKGYGIEVSRERLIQNWDGLAVYRS